MECMRSGSAWLAIFPHPTDKSRPYIPEDWHPDLKQLMSGMLEKDFKLRHNMSNIRVRGNLGGTWFNQQLHWLTDRKMSG